MPTKSFPVSRQLARRITCPRCGAPPEAPCVSVESRRAGKQRKRLHLERMNAMRSYLLQQAREEQLDRERAAGP